MRWSPFLHLLLLDFRRRFLCTLICRLALREDSTRHCCLPACLGFHSSSTLTYGRTLSSSPSTGFQLSCLRDGAAQIAACPMPKTSQLRLHSRNSARTLHRACCSFQCEGTALLRKACLCRACAYPSDRPLPLQPGRVRIAAANHPCPVMRVDRPQPEVPLL